MSHRKLLSVLFLLLSVLNSFAQISIDFPISRIVFQRNNQNEAAVVVAGSYGKLLDDVEVRAIPMTEGQGIAVDWQKSSEFNSNGIFKASLVLKGGWYKVEVRGILNGKKVDSASVSRIGVGEVFIVAGQSNAQGDALYSGGTIGAKEDRVSTIDFYDSKFDKNKLPFEFRQMADSTKMAPYNYVPWFWARLGDKLVKKLNVPILFYGAALGGIGTDVWRRSALGEDLRQELPIFISTAGMPYLAMQTALQMYVTRTGVRAVLWQQGESDAMNSADRYYENMKFIIEKTRYDSKKSDLAWVIARSSNNPDFHPNVVEGQNYLISRIQSVFPGPNTDLIQGENRMDGIHFHKGGLDLAAEYWDNSLDNNFFSKSNPLAARPIPSIKSECKLSEGKPKLRLYVDGYAKYQWSNGSTNNSIEADSGSFSLKTFDEAGNTFYSQTFVIRQNNTFQTSKIIYSGDVAFCEDAGVVLRSSIESGNVWSDGQRGQSIKIFKGGTYTLKNVSINACQNPQADSISLSGLLSPKISIESSKQSPICQGDSLQLTAKVIGGQNLIWNTNAQTNSIYVKKAMNYSVKATGENGCFSVTNFSLSYLPKPALSISADGPTEFCIGKSVKLTAEGNYSKYSWSTGSPLKSIYVTESGTFSVFVKGENGCNSDTIVQKVSVGSPRLIKIKSNELAKFCKGNSITLFPDIQAAKKYNWSTGDTTRTISVSKPGIYRMNLVENNGCQSFIDSIQLIQVPSPVANISTSNDLNVFCEGNPIKLIANDASEYYWNNKLASKELTVNSPGTYTLKIKDLNDCESEVVSINILQKNTPAKPQIQVDGVFQLSARAAYYYPNQYYEWYRDNQLLSTPIQVLKIDNSGGYSVRSALKHTLSDGKILACYSALSDVQLISVPESRGVRIYPNPTTNGVLTIETIDDNPNTLLSIYTLGGKLVTVRSFTDFKEKKRLDLGNFESGTYIFHLTSGSFDESIKIMIK